MAEKDWGETQATQNHIELGVYIRHSFKLHIPFLELFTFSHSVSTVTNLRVSDLAAEYNVCLFVCFLLSNPQGFLRNKNSA